MVAPAVLRLSRTEFLPSRHSVCSSYLIAILSPRDKDLSHNKNSSVATGYLSLLRKGQELDGLTSSVSLPHSSVLPHPSSPIRWLGFFIIFPSSSCLANTATHCIQPFVQMCHSSLMMLTMAFSPSTATTYLNNIGGLRQSRSFPPSTSTDKRQASTYFIRHLTLLASRG